MDRWRWDAIKSRLPPPRFLTLHYAYFIIVCSVSSVIFWAASTPFGSITYVDSLFFTVSAMTLAGLNTVNLSTLNTFQQVLLWLLIMLGSTILVSAVVVIVRRRAFEKEFARIAIEQHQRRRASKWSSWGHRVTLSPTLSLESRSLARSVEQILSPQPEDGVRRSEVDQIEQVSSSQIYNEDSSPLTQDSRRDGVGALPCLRGSRRNSTLPYLNAAEKDKLGGFLGAIAVGASIALNHASLTERNGIDPWLVFLSSAALEVDWHILCYLRLQQFRPQCSRREHGPLSIIHIRPYHDGASNLIREHMVIGSHSMAAPVLNRVTSYPVFLRLILYTMRRLLPDNDFFVDLRGAFDFLLKHPRRCYTNLFPSAHTWWLLCSVVILNGIDWIAFEVLNFNNPAVTSIATGPRILDGLFQALCVRNGGFYIISITTLQIGTQLLYVVMMYISAYPVVITMRHTNVYEERSLGIYADDPSIMTREDIEGTPRRILPFSPSGRLYFVRQQLQAQLAHDLWWIVLAVVIIGIVEAGNFSRDPVTYSVFNISFEIVSAYGCVGITTGLPDQKYSFSGGWHTLSKLVLCAVMLRGRHRGLPVAIDRAILLPGLEHLATEEEERAQLRMEGGASQNSDVTIIE
ncbi:Cation transport domain containing protein [Elaphomyces granulatus]